MNTKTKAVIAYLIVLIAGFAAGYVVHSIQTARAPGFSLSEQGRWEHQRGPMGLDSGISQRAGERLSQQLSLQQDQKELFFARIGDFHRGVREEIRSRRENEKMIIRERYRDFREDVSEILTETQLEKLDEIAHPDSVESRRHSRRRGR